MSRGRTTQALAREWLAARRLGTVGDCALEIGRVTARERRAIAAAFRAAGAMCVPRFLDAVWCLDAADAARVAEDAVRERESRAARIDAAIGKVA